MYKHILIATDGSEFSRKAADHGLALAKSLGAKVTVLTVTLPWSALALSEIARGLDSSDYETRIRKQGDAWLAPIVEKANAIGVSCRTTQLSGERPYEEIINAAKDHGCDAIVVGSHGRRGIAGLLLGSETVKLLTHSKLPVIVYRE